MKGELIAKKCKVLNVEKRTTQDGSINWTEVTFLQDNYCNTINCDNKVADQLKTGSSYDLVITISEVPKAYKSGNGAYIENKFKITGLDLKTI